MKTSLTAREREVTKVMWKVIADLGVRKNRSYVLCECTCGKEKAVQLNSLLQGTSKSCRACGSSKIDVNKPVNWYKG